MQRAMNLIQWLWWQVLKQKIRRRFPSVRRISTAELADWLSRSPRPLLLDTRTAAEYAVSHLPQAQWFDPETEAAHFDLGAKDAPIVTYCSVGYRSARVADRLQAAGFTHVANLEGSIFQWANEGKRVYRGGQPVRQVHPYNAAWGRLLDSRFHAEQP